MLKQNEEVKLHYVIINAGDGSAYVHFHDDEKKARSEENDQEEPFAESSVSSLVLKVIDGIIHFKSEKWDGKKHQTIWTKLK